MNFADIQKRLFLSSKFGRDVLWNVCSLVVLAGMGLLINGMIMMLRGPEALGIFIQVFACFIIASQVAVGGLQSSVLKHCSYVQNDLPECSRITEVALVLVSVTALAVCGVLFALSGFIGQFLESPSVSIGILMAIPALFFYSLNKVLLMALNARRYMRAFAVFQAARYVFIFLGVTGAILSESPNSYLPLALTFAEFLLFVLLACFIQGWVLSLSLPSVLSMRVWMPRHLAFATRGFMSGVMIETNTKVDIIVLGIFLPDTLVGIYGFAAAFAEGFAQLPNVVRQNVDPLLGDAFSKGDHGVITVLATRIRRIFGFLMLQAGVALIVAFPLVAIPLVGEAWRTSWILLSMLVSGVVIGASYRPFMGILLQADRPGSFTIFMTGSVLCHMALNFCLVPLLGVYGAALSTSVIYVLEVLTIVFLARRMLHIQL